MPHIENLVAAYEQAGIPRDGIEAAMACIVSWLTPNEQAALRVRLRNYKPR